MRRSAGVEGVLEQSYDVMRGTGSAGELFSTDVTVAVGTDDEEWDTDHATAVEGFLSQNHEAGPLQVQAGSPHGYSDGGFGWFEDRPLVTFANGESAPVRVTGVTRFENGRWRVVQIHTSIGLPNAELGLNLTTNSWPPPNT